MAAIKITDIINLTESPLNIPPKLVRNLCMVNEPNNELVQYYITNDCTEDKATNIAYSNYTTAQWGDIRKRITARSVSKIGVKAFPGVGAIAHFKYKYNGHSMIVCPVNNHTKKFVAPILKMTKDGSSLIFTIIPPKDITYECYRIILRCKEFAYEYVTYELSLVIPMPEVKGSYTIYCIGYENEGEAISYDSNIITLDVTEGQNSFAPASKIAYYTQDQIQAIVAALTDRYLREAAFVEDGTKLKFTMSDNQTFYASGSPSGGSPQLPLTIANAVVAGGNEETASLTNTLNVVANSDVILCIISRYTVNVPIDFDLLYEYTVTTTDTDPTSQFLRIYKKHVTTAEEISITITQEGNHKAFNFFACNVVNASNFIIGQVTTANPETEEVTTIDVLKTSNNAIIITHQIYAFDDTIITSYVPDDDCLLFEANARGHYIIDKSKETSHKLTLGTPSNTAIAYKNWQTIVLNIS